MRCDGCKKPIKGETEIVIRHLIDGLEGYHEHCFSIVWLGEAAELLDKSGQDALAKKAREIERWWKKPGVG